MAYLKPMRGKYYSIISLWDGIKQSSKTISLNTDSKTTARQRHAIIEKHEKDIKNGMEYSFPWQNGGGKTEVKLFTLSDAIDLFLRHKTNIEKVRLSTIQCYKEAFSTFIECTCNLNIKQISLRHIDLYIQFLQANKKGNGSPLSINTINNRIRCIKSFMIWLDDRDIIHKAPKISEQGYRNLSGNALLPWSEQLIEKFQDKWDWNILSQNEGLPWNEELLNRFSDKWNWSWFCENPGFPWTENLIEKYQDKWDWENLSCNMYFPWTDEIIIKYEDKWNWQWLSVDAIITEELFNKYIDRWDWENLSENNSFPWSEELIEKYEDKWKWSFLSINEGLPWSEELFNKYIDRWDWGHLSENEALPWSIELIEKYRINWDWNRLSYNKGLPWSIQLIEKYEDRWDWAILSKNEGLPWSRELLDEFVVKWDWELLGFNISLWDKVFMPHVTDEIIEAVLKEFYYDDLK